MSKRKDSGSVAGDVLLWGGVGVGAFLLIRSMRGSAAIAQPAAPAASSSGGGILSAIFGALTGAGASVAGAAQQTVAPAAPVDTSALTGPAASVGSAISNAFGWLLGPSTPAQDAHEAQHATSGLEAELGSLGGTVFDSPTLPMKRGRTVAPSLTGRVPGRRARRYR